MIVVQVEGNIGAGKSTFLNQFKEKLSNNDKCKHLNVKYVNEPLQKWMNVDNDCNLFDLYYENPKKYAEVFQILTFGTMLNINLTCNYENIDIVFMERSLYTNIHCFVKLLLDQNYVDPIFDKVLKSLFKTFKDKIIHPDIVIYLQTDNIVTLQKRISTRGRTAEKDIPTEYLTNLNNIYNDVINNHDYFNKSSKHIIPIEMTKEEQASKYFDKIIKNIINKLNL